MALYVIDNQNAPIEFETREFVTRTLQNAKNLLMCHKGEVAYDRFRGFDTRFYDLPLEEIRKNILQELDRIMQWEPDVEVTEAKCELDEKNHLYIQVVLEINI